VDLVLVRLDSVPRRPFTNFRVDVVRLDLAELCASVLAVQTVLFMGFDIYLFH